MRNGTRDRCEFSRFVNRVIDQEVLALSVTWRKPAVVMADAFESVLSEGPLGGALAANLSCKHFPVGIRKHSDPKDLTTSRALENRLDSVSQRALPPASDLWLNLTASGQSALARNGRLNAALADGRRVARP